MQTADAAKRIYTERLQSKLESTHAGYYVAIEPTTESHYVAKTFVEAALAARNAHPESQPFVIRIGHDAAFHLGVSGL